MLFPVPSLVHILKDDWLSEMINNRDVSNLMLLYFIPRIYIQTLPHWLTVVGLSKGCNQLLAVLHC